jgi:glycosyltransferase involved in cell wall biosynthesis
MKVVVPSRRRASIIGKATMKMLPSATVSIAEEEVGSYERGGVKREQMLVHPNEIFGISKTRNWILKNMEDETVVFVDDDIAIFISMVGENYRRITTEPEIMQILENGEACAKDIGTTLFCFSGTNDIRKYKSFEPFSLVGHPSGVFGVIGREFWFDEEQLVHDDMDFSFQVLEKKRIIWIDNRFGTRQLAQTTKLGGGCQSFLTESLDVKERRYLKRKWGKYYELTLWKTTSVTMSHMKVERRQRNLITPETI